MTAAEVQELIDGIPCDLCYLLPGNMVNYAILAALIDVANGDPVPESTQELIAESNCLICMVPPGLVPYLMIQAIRGITGGGGGGAPTNATYITQTPNATLSAEQAVSALATGLLKGTTGTGVVSIASSGVDYSLPLSGAASPEGVITASPGQPYWKTNAPQELFIKSTGVATNTGWVSVLTL